MLFFSWFDRGNMFFCFFSCSAGAALLATPKVFFPPNFFLDAIVEK